MIAVAPDNVLLLLQYSSRYGLGVMNSSLYDPGCSPEVV